MVIAISTWPYNSFLSTAAGRSKALTYAQGAYSDLASETKVALSRNPDRLPILVQWPADIVEGIAKLLPPASLASLAQICHQLRTLLDVDRLWQHQLQQCCLAWYATGVCPTDGHHNRQTWKQLAIAAADGQMLTFYIPVMTNLPAVKSKTQDVWNSGAEKLQLDMYLSFIQACEDQATCGPSCDSDTLVWYGAAYARRDLEEALREMTKLIDTSHLVSRRSYTSCYDSGSWQHLHEDAASLLHFLAEFQAIQEDDLMIPPGLGLLALAAAHPAGQDSEAQNVFKEHVLYASGTFLTRLQRRASDLFALADHGRMCSSVAQYARAAHYYRLQAVDCYSKSPMNPEFDVDRNLVNVAQAMYNAWIETGELVILQQALSWAMYLVERINNLQNMSAYVGDYAPSNMSHVCEMLSHPDACRLSDLWPENFDVKLLRIGATLLSIHRLDQGGAVYQWLRSRIQNALALEAAFELILRSNAEAASQEPPLPPSLLAVIQTGLDGTVDVAYRSLLADFAAALLVQAKHLYRHEVLKQAFFLFHEAMVLASHHQLDNSLLKSARTGMAWSILYLVNKLGCKSLILKDGQEISIDLGLAESYGKLALGKAADRAKAVDFLAYVAEAQCLFQLAKQRYEEVHNFSMVQASSDQKYGGSDLEGAKRYLQSVSDLCETTGIDQPGFVQRYLHGLVAASHGCSIEAQKHFRAALVAAQRQPDKQQEAQAVTAIGTIMCFYHPGIQKQEDGWDFLVRGLTLARLVEDSCVRPMLPRQTLAKQQHAAGCIQRAWRTYHSSPYRAHKLAAVVRLQAGIRALAARQHASYLRHQHSAIAAMESAMLSGSRSQLQAAAAQLVQAGLAQLSQVSVRSFEHKVSTASIQLKQAAQGGSGAQWEEAAQHAQCFDHLAGDIAEAQDVFMARQKQAEAAVMAALRDASLERVQSLIAKAALLNAEPFSIGIFRLRLLDARRLGLNTEAHSVQGDLEVRRQSMARQLQHAAVHEAAVDVQDLCLRARQLGLLEHPKDCTAAWQNGRSSEQQLWQSAGPTEQTSTGESSGRQHDVSHVGQKHVAWAVSLQQEGKLVQQLIAKLQKGLVRLEATGNDLTSLAGLETCVGLTHLRLNQNKIESLHQVQRLSNLRGLYLADNHIAEFPHHLPHLRELTVSDNQLTSLEGLQACPLLLGLAAQHNKITAFPAVLACLLLRMLNLNGNRIRSVSETPWLPHLIHLKLQDNLITHMGPLPNLPFIQSLDLSFNHISEFGVVQTLASFQHLRSLRVNDNPVQHEPRFYFSLQRLMPWTQHEFGAARRVRCGQGQEAWDRQANFNLVSRQSVQLSQLTHLLHWRPAFPLTHTSPAFWHKLLPSLASSHLLDDAELQLVRALADDAPLRNAMVERADFAELAGLWDQRFRRHFQMQLQQPPCIHQGKLEGSALYAQQQAANAAAAATCIQAVWRGRQARRSTASLRVVLQQQRQRDRAATAIQAAWRGHTVREQALLHLRRQAAASQQAIMQTAAAKIQAVVRGRKLRQQLSQARQAAAYTDDTSHADSHDADLDMDDMDEFLASLPDDEPPPAQSVAATSSPAQSVASTSSPALAYAPGSTLAGGATPAAPHQVLPSNQLADARRSSHASASTSGESQASSIHLSWYHHAAGFPVAFQHSSRAHTDASLAVNTSGAVRESPQRSHSTSAWGPQSSVGAVTQTVHRSLSAAELSSSTGAFTQRPPGQQTSSGKSSRHGSQQQQQQEPFLPVLTGSHGAAPMQIASMPGLASASTTNTGSRISLPPIQESPNERSPGPVDPNSVGSSYSGLAAAASTAVGGSEEDSQEAARGNNGRSARVSRASSSVRSEQSVGSQSPDKAAAKQERHKEWKVGDFAVAESIFKSRQRQLKQKGGAQMRQKMQDPEARLARLKSQLGGQAPNSRAASVPRHPCNRDLIHMRHAALPEPSLETGQLGSLSADGSVQQLLDSRQQHR
ncbi:hypothetical protein WJX82_002138 [Trebouxia sp. C0006]